MIKYEQDRDVFNKEIDKDRDELMDNLKYKK